MERSGGCRSVIARYWSAHTTQERAPDYANHLQTSIFPELEKLDGYSGGMLLQRDGASGAVEVVVITFWTSIESVRAFAGDDIEQAVVPEKAVALLDDFDRRVRHYDVVIKADQSFK